MDSCLQTQLHQLKIIGERLCLLQSHDALTILRHSFALPKLLYTLRTSPAYSSSLLVSWDNLLRSIVSRITNIDFRPEDPSWLQATLPINSGGLGIRSASHLAPSAFLASADEASKLIHHLLPHNLVDITYSERDLALSSWSQELPPDTPPPSSPSQQRSWDNQELMFCLSFFFQAAVTKNLEPVFWPPEQGNQGHGSMQHQCPPLGCDCPMTLCGSPLV
jgi:hypothetical protein